MLPVRPLAASGADSASPPPCFAFRMASALALARANPVGDAVKLGKVDVHCIVISCVRKFQMQSESSEDKIRSLTGVVKEEGSGGRANFAGGPKS